MQFSLGRLMKFGGLAVAAVALVGLGRFTAPVWAAEDESATLIDKDFESCIAKRVQRRFFNFIEASSEQKEKIETLVSQRRQESRPARENLRHGLSELSDLMSSENADDKQIKDKVHQLRALNEKIMDERVETALKVRALLSPGQRKAIGERVTALLTGKFKFRGLLGT